MAKKTPGLRAALKVVDQLGHQMTAEADADYAVGLSASNAGQRALRKQTRGLTRDLLAGQQVQGASLSRLAREARAQKGAVSARQSATVGRYGAALGGSIANAFGVANATASGTANVLAGAAKAGHKQAKVAGTVAGIAAQGVAAQKQAAAYSMNQALQQRAIVDNQTLAGLTGQLYETALQYNMQWQMWKKQQDYAAKQAEKANGFGSKGDAQRLMQEGGAIASAAADSYRDWKAEHPDEDINVSTAAAEYAAEYNYDPAGPEVTLFSATIRNLKSGTPYAADAYGQAMNTLFGGAKGFDQWGQAVIQGGQTQIILDQTREAFQAWTEQNPDAWWLADKVAPGAGPGPGGAGYYQPNAPAGPSGIPGYQF
jgi:hypothetical protein